MFFLEKSIIDGHEHKNKKSADLYINGLNVGGINYGECLVIDIAPGNYVFSFKERSPNPYMVNSLTANIASGNPIYLSMDVGMALGPIVPGLIPALIALAIDPPRVLGGLVEHEIDGPQMIQELKIVLPDKATLSRLIVR
jgi:hypothetical protein